MIGFKSSGSQISASPLKKSQWKIPATLTLSFISASTSGRDRSTDYSLETIKQELLRDHLFGKLIRNNLYSISLEMVLNSLLDSLSPVYSLFLIMLTNEWASQ